MRGEIVPAALVPAALLACAVLCWPGRPAGGAVQALTRPPAGEVAPAPAAEGLLRALGPVPGRMLSRRRTRADRTRTDEAVLALLDALAAALSTGLTPAAALAVSTAGPTGTVLRDLLAPVASAAAQGRPTGPVWERVARHSARPDLAALARAWVVSERLGAPLADAVRTTAASVRARTLLEQRLGSATAGARATTTLLSALPLGGVALALTLGVDPSRLYGTPLAATSLGAGLLLLLGGRLVVARMVGRVRAGL